MLRYAALRIPRSAFRPLLIRANSCNPCLVQDSPLRLAEEALVPSAQVRPPALRPRYGSAILAR
jgi:hypothetical protein